jgi:hypothetical protein
MKDPEQLLVEIMERLLCDRYTARRPRDVRHRRNRDKVRLTRLVEQLKEKS